MILFHIRKYYIMSPFTYLNNVDIDFELSILVDEIYVYDETYMYAITG